MNTIRNQAKENAKKYVENNIDRLNELSHQSHNHIWVEVTPDGQVSMAEEADISTRHLSNGGEIANVLTIASCEYCDCDACSSYRQSKDDDISDEDFSEHWGYIREDVSDSFAQHLKDCEAYNYDMADEVEEAIDDLPQGYFEDEKAYMIDYTAGSGSGCDTIFETREDAERHMSNYTAKERDGLEIAEVRVDANGSIVEIIG